MENGWEWGLYVLTLFIVFFGGVAAALLILE